MLTPVRSFGDNEHNNSTTISVNFLAMIRKEYSGDAFGNGTLSSNDIYLAMIRKGYRGDTFRNGVVSSSGSILAIEALGEVQSSNCQWRSSCQRYIKVQSSTYQ